MSEPQRDRPEPYSRPPHRTPDPKPGREAWIGVALEVLLHHQPPGIETRRLIPVGRGVC